MLLQEWTAPLKALIDLFSSSLPPTPPALNTPAVVRILPNLLGYCFYSVDSDCFMSVLIAESRKTVLLKSSECSQEVLNFLANKACECYVALSDWESVQEWQASMMNLKKNSSSSGVNLKTDLNYIRCAAVEHLSVSIRLVILEE